MFWSLSLRYTMPIHNGKPLVVPWVKSLNTVQSIVVVHCNTSGLILGMVPIMIAFVKKACVEPAFGKWVAQERCP